MKHFLIPACMALACSCLAQTSTPRADFPGQARFGAVQFAINNLLYVGLGEAGAGTYPQDFYRYDVVTNQWTPIANFPGAGRETAISFALNGKGYVGLGASFTSTATSVFKDLWRYDPVTNAWTQLGNFDGPARSKATVFVLNGAAYVGTGSDDAFGFRSDWWKYDPAADQWTIQNNLGNLPPRYGAVAYVVNNKAYLSGGRGNAGVFFSEIHEFNPASGAGSGWVLKNTDPVNLRFESAAAFVLNNKAYLCYGLSSNFVSSYDPITNTVTNLGDVFGLGDPIRYAPIAHATSSGKGYFGLGYGSVVSNQQAEYRNDFWQFNPITTATYEPVGSEFVQVNPTISNGRFRVTISPEARFPKLSFRLCNAQGTLLETSGVIADGYELDLTYLAAGMYFLKFQAGNEFWTQKIVKI